MLKPYEITWQPAEAVGRPHLARRNDLPHSRSTLSTSEAEVWPARFPYRSEGITFAKELLIGISNKEGLEFNWDQKFPQ